MKRLSPAALVTITPTELRDHLQAALGASFTVERELGRGRTSHVFLATDQTLERKVVLKVLNPKLAAGVSAERFKREIRIMARLQHPHIVPILATGEIVPARRDATDTIVLPYFTMPFVEGDTLRARLNRDGTIGINESVRIMRDVASALEFAHDNGIVHRDIKPGNILIAGRSATVSDFGVAKALSASTIGAGRQDGVQLTGAGVPLGTPLYMSPEQALADPETDHRADIYALGVVAYEMLAGQPPFKGLGPLALLTAQMKDEPPRVDTLRGDTPPSLVKLVARCLAKDSGGRPQSAAEVLHLLDDVPLRESGGFRESRADSS